MFVRVSFCLAQLLRRSLMTATEDIVILGHRVPKGTTIMFTTTSGYEDSSSPLYAMPSVPADPNLDIEKNPGKPRITTPDPHNSSMLAGDDTFASRTNAALDVQRFEKEERKTGYWKAGTGRVFDPERWLVDGKFDANAGPSLPFSLGSRGCFGKNLAVSVVATGC